MELTRRPAPPPPAELEDVRPEAMDGLIGERVKALRAAARLTLDGLAARSGVSRAMISRIERGEASATAVLLSRLCAGLGVPLASLFAPAAPAAGPVARRADQPVWRDPMSGYVRRNVSPPGRSAVSIVEVDFPPRARVAFDQGWEWRRLDQQVWVLEGVLDFTVEGVTHRLQAGDCLAARISGPTLFANPTDAVTRYAVVIVPEPVLPAAAPPGIAPAPEPDRA